MLNFFSHNAYGLVPDLPAYFRFGTEVSRFRVCDFSPMYSVLNPHHMFSPLDRCSHSSRASFTPHTHHMLCTHTHMTVLQTYRWLNHMLRKLWCSSHKPYLFALTVRSFFKFYKLLSSFQTNRFQNFKHKLNVTKVHMQIECSCFDN